MSSNDPLQTFRDMCDLPEMRYSVRIASMLVLSLLVVACHRKEPMICSTSPPDDPNHYQSWADEVTAAHCKNLHMETAPAANGSAASDLR